ncbi:MAG: YidC/Oxa1 family membrane protein insertase [Oscillospiraceae bacterium]|nr:YidC/Oxa1 family membrane protein insertase [Oscillospiraceae bacterium]
MAGIFSYISSIFAYPLGYIMQWCYLLVNDVMKLPVAYVFALFLFTFVTKLLLFPLSLKQQRSSAVMQAYQPLMNEINQKYADNPKKRQEELTKMQQEYGYNPSAGCLPLLIQFPIIFGLVEVVYKPLTYMIRVPKEILELFSDKARELTLAAGGTVNERYIETTIIEKVKTVVQEFLSLGSSSSYSSTEVAEQISKIEGLDLSIGSLNLWETPKLEWSLMLLIPVFSILSVIVSSLISQWAIRGQSDRNKGMQTTNIVMIAVSTVMFGTMSFSFPAAFGLYWGFSNIVTIIQSAILRKVVNADTIRKEAEDKIEEKKKAQKATKVVKVTDKAGQTQEKEMAADELARYRLQKAREMDDKRYDMMASSDDDED